MEVPLPPGAEHVNLPPPPPDEDERMEVLQALELLKDYRKHPGITAICCLLKDCLSMTVAGSPPPPPPSSSLFPLRPPVPLGVRMCARVRESAGGCVSVHVCA